MAQASVTLTPLKRRTVKFKSRESGELVEYHEAICLDEAGDFAIVRSSQKEDIEVLVPDGPAVTMEAEFRKMDTIPATLLRPVGGPRDEQTW
jgi:hypothetical protein